MTKLYTKNITKTYGSKLILQDINIELNENECVSLLGVSGVGKTTLFNILSGIITPDSGNVYLEGYDITGVAGKVGYMLQKDLLLPYKTIIDNITMPLIIRGKKKEEARETVYKYFADFGLEGVENKYPSQLSRRNETKGCIT